MLLELNALLCIGMAGAGCVYSLAAVRAVRAFRSRAPSPAAPTARGITVLKPLHGAEPGLYENLVSFVHQDHVGPVQIVFGIAQASDAARPVVLRLMQEFPGHDLELVVGAQPVDGNAKIANLATMSAAIKHDVVVLSDSDIRVRESYLRETCDTLAEPGVGLVTCIYRGGAASGLWAHLSTMAIDFHFLPSVLLGLRLGKARPCMGATMAFTRSTLDAIGGFRAFVGHLADDYAIGEAVRATGQRVALAAHLVEHRCNERSASDLYLHELRWARTIRSIDPFGFAGSIVTYPLPFAMVAVACGSEPAAALLTLFATLSCRGLLQREVERTLGLATHRWLLGPVRDLASFVVFCSSFVTDVVVWRGRRYRVRPDGTMEELKGLPS